MVKSTKILLAVGGVVLAGGIGWKIYAAKNQKVVYDTVVVRRATITQTVQASGIVSSPSDIDLQFETFGKIASVQKKVGDAVKAGDTIATIVSVSEQVGVSKALAGLRAAQADLAKALAGATPEDVRVSEAAVQNAQANLALSQQTLTDALQAQTDTTTSNNVALEKVYSDLQATCETVLLKATGAVQAMKIDVFETNNIKNDVITTDTTLARQSLTAYNAAVAGLATMSTTIASVRMTAVPAVLDSASASLVVNAKTVRNALQLASALLQDATPGGAITQTAFDARKTDIKNVWADMNSAISGLEAAKNTTATLTATNQTMANAATAKVNAAVQNIAIARSSLASAQASLTLKKSAATPSVIASARAAVASAQATLDQANLILQKTILAAPFAGVIGQMNARTGAQITSTQVAATLVNVNSYEVDADIPESDVTKLKIGMSAVITLDAYGNNIAFSGVLRSIDTTETVIQDVVYYKSRFQLAPSDRLIRPGMTANVTITANEQKNVLVAPARTVRQEGGERSVMSLVNNQPVKKVIIVGISGDSGLTEIVSGLSENDQLVLPGKTTK